MDRGHWFPDFINTVPFSDMEVDLLETLRVITQAHNELNAGCVADMFRSYTGPWIGIDYMICHTMSDLELVDHYELELLLLEAFKIVRDRYSMHDSNWKSLIRRLLRAGFSPYSRFVYYRSRTGIDWQLCGTALDELFFWSSTPYEAAEIGEIWLDLLSSEGWDIRAYLEHEIQIHNSHEQLTYLQGTYLSHEQIERKFKFQFGDTLKVSWVWNLQPSVSIALLQWEFTDIIMNPLLAWIHDRCPLDNCWPFHFDALREFIMKSGHFIKGEDERQRWSKRETLRDKRAVRRFERKRAKRNPMRSSRRRRSIPGAWPS